VPRTPRSNRRRSRSASPAPSASPAAAAPDPGPSRRPPLWAARLLLMLGVPALLLLAAEGALRLTGFGYDPDFFAGAEGSSYVGSNVEFGRSWFPEAIARKPVENLFRDPKPTGTYRIFLLGSSAAIGVPEAAFNFARILGVMLEETFPGTRFEVITTGITATNSHVVRPIAEECARYQPDLFLLYLGNNEVIGPYGVQASDEDGGGPGTAAIQAGTALRRTKLGQAIQLLGQRVAGNDEAPARWQGMERYLDQQVRLGDPRLDRIYANFERNVQAICDAATGAGADIVVCTVASNLADSPPFGALHRPDLTDAQRAAWQERFTAGERALAAGDTSAALAHYEAAAAIDDTHAEVVFRIGQALAARGDVGGAVRQLRRARELDTLRFRADDQLNDILRRVVQRQDHPGVHLADCQRALEMGLRDVDQIPGNELFFEHVHLTFAGNWSLAAAAFRTVVAALPAEIRRQGPGRPAPPPPAVCAQALAYTPWNEYTMIDHVLRMLLPGPPFTGQLDHAQTVAHWEARLAELRQARDQEQAQRIYDQYVAAVRARPDDVLLQIKFIMLLSAGGNDRMAQDRLRQLVARLPESSPLVRSGLVPATM